MEQNTLSETINYLEYTLLSAFSISKFKSLCIIGLVIYEFMFDVAQTKTLLALFILILLDFITGISAAKIRGEPIRSSKIKHSALKLLAYYAVISGAHLAESSLNSYIAFLDDAVIAFFMVTELISLMENIGRMGYKVPSKLLNQLNDIGEKI